MKWSADLPWLLEQIRTCLARIDQDTMNMVAVVDALAQLYADWSETL